jgi:tetratricopeptide (TPR) repeat protein
MKLRFYSSQTENSERDVEVAHRIINVLKFQSNSNAGRAVVDGNLPQMYISYKNASDKDPKNIDYNLWAAGAAIFNWRFTDALSICQQIDPATVTYDVQWEAFWARMYAHCLILQDRYDDARKVIQYIPDRYFFFRDQAMALIYIRRHQYDSLQILQEHFIAGTSLPASLVTDFYEWVAGNLAILKDSLNQRKWAELALKMREKARRNEEGLGTDFYLAGDYTGALKAVQKEISISGRKWDLLSRLGCTYARLQQPKDARAIVHEIESINDKYVRGENQYALAEIHAALGEKEKAVDCAIRAYQEGRERNLGSYEEDFDFTPLLGYPPFMEFIKPKD